MVREQLNELSRVQARVGPVDSVAYQQWLVREWFVTRNPTVLSDRLEKFAQAQAHPLSPDVELLISRWQLSLRRWADVSDQLAPLEEGRLRFAESAGFTRLGRLGDAAVYRLRAALVLSDLILNQPGTEELPEALYLLGVLYLDFGGALGDQIRADRILRLCSDLFPGTIWGARSRERLAGRFERAV